MPHPVHFSWSTTHTKCSNCIQTTQVRHNDISACYRDFKFLVFFKD